MCAERACSAPTEKPHVETAPTQTPNQVVWPWGPAQRIDPSERGAPRASGDGADRACAWWSVYTRERGGGHTLTHPSPTLTLTLVSKVSSVLL